MSFDIIVIVEIPFHSNVKYEIDEDGKIWVDRILSTSMVYPGNYGFIPDTKAGDGDPIDVLILNHSPFYPGSRVKCRVIGVLETSDEKGMDEKILAVPINTIDIRYSHRNDINDISDPEKNLIQHFFENYKKLENNKFVRILGFQDRNTALEYIKKGFANH
jgi:inorganic pyrophosphatase